MTYAVALKAVQSELPNCSQLAPNVSPRIAASTLTPREKERLLTIEHEFREYIVKLELTDNEFEALFILKWRTIERELGEASNG